MNGAANKISGGNSFSPLQSAILDALGKAERPIAAGAILAHITDNPTPSQRATLSRALVRLEKRGVVTVYLPEVMRQGRGYLYGLAG